MTRRVRVLAPDLSADANRRIERMAKRAAYVAPGEEAQYYRGDKTWQPLNAEAVAGLGDAATQVYEEGTWTPVLQFGGASTGITYSTRSGRYTRIGRLVFIEGYLALSSKGSATGASNIAGLPFAPSASLERAAALSHGNLSSITGTAHVVLGGASNVVPVQGSRANITDTSFANNTWLTFTLFYTV